MSNQRRIPSANLGLLLATCLVSACTTFTRQEAVSDRELVSSSSNAETQVVTQVGRTDAIYSRHDRTYWLGLRSQGKGALTKARAALATGEADAAAELARVFLAKNPGHVDGLITLAAALSMGRKYDLAVYYANLVDQAQPGHPVALNIKGLAMMLGSKSRATDLRQASDYFKAAFAANDAQIAPGLNLGYLQLELGDAAAALSTFTEVTRRCDSCAPALMGVGIAANRTGKNDTAKDAFMDVLAKKPNDSSALYHLALVYKNGYNNKKEAEKYLARLLANDKISDVYVKERAQTVLRQIKGEADISERTAIADTTSDSDFSTPGSGKAQTEQSDAELMMSAAEMDGDH